MTYVRFVFTPSEIGFKEPINAEFVSTASTAIRQNLEGVVAQHDDWITRAHDPRRVHDSLESSAWMIKYVRNEILITNQIGNGVSQMSALKEGNAGSPICATHTSSRVRVLKGWSSKDRHRHKTVAGDIGMPFPPVLKFYSKKYGMWMYRQCVKPISSAIVGDFNRDIQRAVLDGLESTYYQAYDNEEYEDVGTNEHLEELPMDLTLEEMTKSNESAITTHHKSVEYQEAKAEEPQKDNDPVAEEVHQKMNVVQTLVYGINKTVDTARAFLKGWGL